MWTSILTTGPATVKRSSGSGHGGTALRETCDRSARCRYAQALRSLCQANDATAPALALGTYDSIQGATQVDPKQVVFRITRRQFVTSSAAVLAASGFAHEANAVTALAGQQPGTSDGESDTRTGR